MFLKTIFPILKWIKGHSTCEVPYPDITRGNTAIKKLPKRISRFGIHVIIFILISTNN